MQPGDPAAPVYVAWSEDSRNSILRVVAHHGQDTRVEVRNPDPACNPYLALAVILKAGLDGIRQKLPQPPPLSGSNNQRQEAQIACLPRSLEEALRDLSADRRVRDTLGDYIYRSFTRAKAEEWERFQAVVHPWELKEYLNAF